MTDAGEHRDSADHPGRDEQSTPESDEVRAGPADQREPEVVDPSSLPEDWRIDAKQSYNRLWGLDPVHPLRHLLWRYCGSPIFAITFHNWYGLRRWMLRVFGADIHPTVRVRPTARISHPWNLRMARYAAIGDHAIIYSHGKVSLGERASVSQYAHLCAAGHDYTQRSMPLIADEIQIEDDVWIAADVFVGPGVTIGRDTVVGARSTVLHNLPERSVTAGDNAKRIGERVITWPPPGQDVEDHRGGVV